MKLITQHGDSFEFLILGYQYPTGVKYYWDLNWLNIQINVTRARSTWTATDASVLTRDIPELATWFENIHYGNKTHPYFRFDEPTLVFQRKKLSRNMSVIRVYIDYELLPERYRHQQSRKQIFVEFPIATIDLLGVAESLRSQLAKYPERLECFSA